MERANRRHQGDVVLSIVIVNWNSKDYVRKCLRSIELTCTELEPEIIVTDGASFDGCQEMIEEEFPYVVYVQSHDNIGFGRCNNLGFEKSTGDVVLFLNPDTEVHEGAIQNMLGLLKSVPDIGMVGARLLNSDGTLQKSAVRTLPNPWNRAIESNAVDTILGAFSLGLRARALKSDEPVEVEAISGACMMMRWKTFEEIGGFSPQYFMYGEDMDLCAKLNRIDKGILYCPDARIVHHGGGCTTEQVSRSSIIAMRESGLIYMKLNHGTASLLAYRILQAIAAAIRIGILGLTCIARPADVNCRNSFKKWLTVFRWSIGLERA
jgi:N-acetylglucosaminyl-diphospho-decaprenol L-rhamnosyltransferase